MLIKLLVFLRFVWCSVRKQMNNSHFFLKKRQAALCGGVNRDCEFKAILVYLVSFRPSRAVYWDSGSEQNKQQPKPGGAREPAWWLRTQTTIPEDLSSVPNTCFGWLIATCNSCSKGVQHFWLPHTPKCAYLHIHTHGGGGDIVKNKCKITVVETVWLLLLLMIQQLWLCNRYWPRLLNIEQQNPCRDTTFLHFLQHFAVAWGSWSYILADTWLGKAFVSHQNWLQWT